MRSTKDKIELYEKLILDEKLNLSKTGKDYSPNLHLLTTLLKHEYKKLEEENGKFNI